MFSGRNKYKSKKGGSDKFVGFGLLGEDGEGKENEEEASGLTAETGDSEEEEVPSIIFSGKKKKKSSKKGIKVEKTKFTASVH